MNLKFKVEDIGEYLKNKRKAAGITLKSLSESIDLSIGYLSRIENGSSTPSLETLYKLSSVLKFQIEDVYEFENIDLSRNAEIEISDLFEMFNVTINGNRINELSKTRMANLLKTIEKMDWSNSFLFEENVQKVILLVDRIKRGV